MPNPSPRPLPRNLWQNQTLFVLGGGPSLKQTDLSLIHDRRIIGVNNSYGDPEYKDGQLVRYIPRSWVDLCWFGDSPWFDQHRPWLKQFPGILAHCVPRLGKLARMAYYERGGAKGIQERAGTVAWNWNSGGSAVNLAWHLGAETVVLLGFDMRKVEGAFNWHKDHLQETSPNPFRRMLGAFHFIARDAERLGLRIINATPGSAIDNFPIMSLEAFLAIEKGLDRHENIGHWH